MLARKRVKTATTRVDPARVRRDLLVGGLALAAVLAGCTTTRPAPSAYLPPGPAIIEVIEQDYGYVLEPAGDIPPGRSVFHLRNASGLAHDLSLVALPEDVPPIGDQLRSTNRRAVATLARRPSRPPGGRDVFAVDLRPGRYALLCFEDDGTGRSHALRGQTVEFRVRRGA